MWRPVLEDFIRKENLFSWKDFFYYDNISQQEDFCNVMDANVSAADYVVLWFYDYSKYSVFVCVLRQNALANLSVFK